MDRRAWLAGSLGIVATPCVAQAQSATKPVRIGLLGGSPPTGPDASPVWASFFEGLRELGYVEGRNVVIEGRFYGDDVERLPALAAELVRIPVDVIVAGASPAPEAARRATTTIPIVMASHGGPVEAGLVASLARPGGNVTGLSAVGYELRAKHLQLLRDAVPGLKRVAVLTSQGPVGHASALSDLAVAARTLDLQLQIVEARSPDDFTTAFSAATKQRAGAIMLLGSSMIFAHRARLAALATQAGLPSIHQSMEYAHAGGLMSYGADVGDNFRKSARYVARILQGAKPADLPVEQPTKFELVINLKTAKALQIKIPQIVLIRADRLIE
jgi:putative tryptophan/tyrosine transport system substrate-binding protein